MHDNLRYRPTMQFTPPARHSFPSHPSALCTSVQHSVPARTHLALQRDHIVVQLGTLLGQAHHCVLQLAVGGLEALYLWVANHGAG